LFFSFVWQEKTIRGKRINTLFFIWYYFIFIDVYIAGNVLAHGEETDFKALNCLPALI
jgi:hypothetical protein